MKRAWLRFHLRLRYLILKNSHGPRRIGDWWRRHVWNPVCFFQGHVYVERHSEFDQEVLVRFSEESSPCARCGRDFQPHLAPREDQFLVPTPERVYPYLPGKPSGQILFGSSSGDLVIQSTHHTQKGQIVFDESSKDLKFYNGEDWKTLGH